MAYAVRIVELFGGVRPMAEALGCPPTTVQRWKDTGFIPARRQQEVLEKARAKGLVLSPLDFFEPQAAE
jgi:hypothetical protein